MSSTAGRPYAVQCQAAESALSLELKLQQIAANRNTQWAERASLSRARRHRDPISCSGEVTRSRPSRETTGPTRVIARC